MNKEDLLIRYFEKSLSSEELQQFEQLLASDASFREQVEEERVISNAVILKERQQIRKQLDTFRPGTVRRIASRSWRVAAIFVALLGVAWWWMSTGDNQEDLFSKHFRPYPNMIAPSVRGNNDTSLKYRAMLAYDREQYKEAIPLLAALHHQTENDTVLLYQAISEIKTQKKEAALLRLEAIRLNDSLYRPATWYAALGYLSQDKKKKTQTLLKQLADTPGTFSDQAAALLRDLR